MSAVMALGEDAKGPARKITSPFPLDVSDVSSHELRACLLLAASLGWNVHNRPGKAVRIVSKSGLERTVSSDESSVRRGYLTGLLAFIMQHRDPARLASSELVETILKMTKPNRSFIQEFRVVSGAGKPPTPDPVPIEGIRLDAPKIGDTKPAKKQVVVPLPTPVPEEEARTIAKQIEGDEIDFEFRPVSEAPAATGQPVEVKREPYVWVSKDGAKRRASEVSDLVTLSDGSTKFGCRLCPELFSNVRALGPHRQSAHAAEVASQWASKGVGYTPAIHRKKSEAFDQLIDAISELGLLPMKPSDREVELEAENARLTAELTAANERVTALEGNLTALKSLIGDALK